jgi:hypothetical protein
VYKGGNDMLKIKSFLYQIRFFVYGFLFGMIMNFILALLSIASWVAFTIAVIAFLPLIIWADGKYIKKYLR